MAGFALRDDGYAQFKKITQGRKWVGRVAKTADGDFLGVINGKPRLEVRAASEREAFEEVVARFYGHASAASLYAHNARVRAGNKTRRAVARYAVDQALNHGNFDPFFRVLDN